MPYGPGTYGSKRGRPPAKKKTMSPKQAKIASKRGPLAKKKPMSPKQEKIAGMAGNKSKIDAADFKKLRSKKK